MADFEAILGGSCPSWLSDAEEQLRQGQGAGALEAAQKASSDAKRSGKASEEGAALLLEASAALEVGSFDVASKASSEALRIFQTNKESVGESAALVLVSRACAAAGQFQDALSTAEDAMYLAEKSSSSKQKAYCQAAIAAASLGLLQNKENVEPATAAKALQAAQEAASVLRSSSDKSSYSAVLLDLSAAYLLAGNSNMALAKAKAAQQIFQATSSSSGEAKSLVAAARALQKEGSRDAAMSTLAEAARLFEAIGDQYGRAEAYDLMSTYEALELQERRDFTQRIIQRFEEKASAEEDKFGLRKHSFSPGVKPHFFLPPQQPVELGVAMTKIIGFMGKAAIVVPDKGKKSGPKPQNRFLLYNVTWS